MNDFVATTSTQAQVKMMSLTSSMLLLFPPPAAAMQDESFISLD